VITIKKVEKEDIAKVKELLLETWIDTYGAIMSEDTISKITSIWHDPARLEAQANDEKIIFQAAIDNFGEMIGLITIGKNDGDTADLLRLYIHPDKQRQGIGNILLEQALKELKEYKRVRLEVEEANQKGKSFYYKFGFKEVEKKVENIEGEKFNTIIMEKSI